MKARAQQQDPSGVKNSKTWKLNNNNILVTGNFPTGTGTNWSHTAPRHLNANALDAARRFALVLECCAPAPAPGPLTSPLIGGLTGSSLLISQQAASLQLAQIKAQLALTQISNAIANGNRGVASKTSGSTHHLPTTPPAAAALNLLNFLKAANTMSNPLYNPYAPGAQRSTQGQYGLTGTQAGMDPWASSRLGSGSGLGSSSSGPSTNPGGMISSMHPQTMSYGPGQSRSAHTADMESTIDMHIRGAKEEVRRLSQMMQQKQQQQQQARDWDRDSRQTKNPREEMPSLGAGLTSYPLSSSSTSFRHSVGHSDKQSSGGSSMDLLSSYQTPSAASSSNFYPSSTSSSSMAQNVPLSHSSQSSNVFQNKPLSYSSQSSKLFPTSSYTAAASGGSSSYTSSEQGGTMPSIPGLGDCSDQPSTDQPSSSSTTNRPKYTFESATNILKKFGLENEDLELLTDYPDNELTPENLPFILRDIRLQKSKRAAAVSGSDMDHWQQTSGAVGGSDHFGASGGGLRRPEESTHILRQPSKVIDYGHSSKYTGGFGDDVGGGSGSLGSGGGGNESTSMMDCYSSSSHGREPPPKDFGTVKYSGAGSSREQIGSVSGSSSSREQISSVSGSSTSYGSVVSSVSLSSLDLPKRSQRPEQNSQPIQSLIQSQVSLPKKDKDDWITESKSPKSILVKKPEADGQGLTTTLVRGVNPDRPSLVLLGSQEDDDPQSKDQRQGDTGQGQTVGLQGSLQMNQPQNLMWPPPFSPMNKNVPPPPFHIPAVPGMPRGPISVSALQMMPRGPIKFPAPNPGAIRLMRPPPLPRMTVPPPPLMPPAATTVAKRLPTPTMMSDYSANTPRIFPHTCSLCNIECKQMKDWISHQNSGQHLDSCRLLRNKYPDWNAETTTDTPTGKPKQHQSQPSPVSKEVQHSPSSSQSSKHRRQATSSSRSHSGSRSWSRSPSPRRHHGNAPSRSSRETRRARSRSWSSSPSPRRHHGNAPSGSSRETRRARSRSPRSSRHTRRSFSRSPRRSPPSSSRRSPPSSSRRSPPSSSRRSPPSSSRRSPPSSSSSSHRRQSRSSPKSSSHQQNETSAERLAKKLLKTSAAHSIADRSGLEAMLQSLAPALLAELAKMKSSKHPSKGLKTSSARTKKESSKPSSEATSGPGTSKTTSASSSKAQSRKHPKIAPKTMFRLKGVSRHMKYDKLVAAVERFGKSKMVIHLRATEEVLVCFENEADGEALYNCEHFTIGGQHVAVTLEKEQKKQTDKKPITSSASKSTTSTKKSQLTTLKPPTATPAKKPLLPLPPGVPNQPLLKSVIQSVKGTKATGCMTTSTVKVLVSKARAPGMKQIKTPQQGKTLVKVATKKATAPKASLLNLRKLESTTKELEISLKSLPTPPMATVPDVVLIDLTTPEKVVVEAACKDSTTSSKAVVDAAPKDATTPLEAVVDAAPKDATTPLEAVVDAAPKDVTTPPKDAPTQAVVDAAPKDATTQAVVDAAPKDATTPLEAVVDAAPKNATTPLEAVVDAAPKDVTTPPKDAPTPLEAVVDAAPKDATIQAVVDAAPKDATTPLEAVVDAAPKDATTPLEAVVDAAPKDATTPLEAVVDAAPKDATTPLEAVVDAAPKDATTPLEAVVDAAPKDATTPLEAVVDAAPKDATTPLEAVVDAALKDATTPLEAVVDAAPKDATTPLEAVVDAAPKDATTPLEAVVDAAPKDATTPLEAVVEAAPKDATTQAVVDAAPKDATTPLEAVVDAAPKDATTPLEAVVDAAPKDATTPLEAVVDAAPKDATTPLEAVVDAAPKDAPTSPKDAPTPPKDATTPLKAVVEAAPKDAPTPPKDAPTPPKDSTTPSKAVVDAAPKDATTPPKDSTTPSKAVVDAAPKDATTPPKDSTTPSKAVVDAAPKDATTPLKTSVEATSKNATTPLAAKDSTTPPKAVVEPTPTASKGVVEAKPKDSTTPPKAVVEPTPTASKGVVEAKPKDSTTPPKGGTTLGLARDTESADISKIVGEESTSTTASSGEKLTVVAAPESEGQAETIPPLDGAQSLRLRWPKGIRGKNLSQDQIWQVIKRFHHTHQKAIVMITNLPLWTSHFDYTQHNIIQLLEPYGYVHTNDNLYILPQQGMAFAVMPSWNELISMVSEYDLIRPRLKGSTLIFSMVTERLDLTQDQAYESLMRLSDKPLVDTGTLSERLMLFISVDEFNPQPAILAIRKAAANVAYVRNHLSLMGRVYVEFESEKDVDEVLQWFKRSSLFKKYVVHIFKTQSREPGPIPKAKPAPAIPVMDTGITPKGPLDATPENQEEGVVMVTPENQEGVVTVTPENQEGVATVTPENQEGVATVTPENQEGVVTVTPENQEGVATVTLENQEGVAVVTPPATVSVEPAPPAGGPVALKVPGAVPPFWTTSPRHPYYRQTHFPQFNVPLYWSAKGLDPTDIINHFVDCDPGLEKVAMITGLPEDGCSVEDITALALPWGYVPGRFNVFVLPFQRRAFVRFPQWFNCCDFVLANTEKPVSLQGCELTFHIVLKTALSLSANCDDEEKCYMALMNLSNVAVRRAQLVKRLTIVDLKTWSPEIFGVLIDIVSSSCSDTFKRYLPLADRVYFEMSSADGANKLFNLYNAHRPNRFDRDVRILNLDNRHHLLEAIGKVRSVTMVERDERVHRRKSAVKSAQPSPSLDYYEMLKSGVKPAKPLTFTTSAPQRPLTAGCSAGRGSDAPATEAKSGTEEETSFVVKLEGIPKSMTHENVLGALRRFGNGKKVVQQRHQQEALVWFDKKKEADALANCKNFKIGGKPVSIIMITYKSSSYRGHHSERSSPGRCDSSRHGRGSRAPSEEELQPPPPPTSRRTSSSGPSSSSKRGRHEESPAAKRRRGEEEARESRSSRRSTRRTQDERQGLSFATDDFTEDDLDLPPDAYPFDLDDFRLEEFVTVDEVGDAGNESSRPPRKSSSSDRRSTKTPSTPERSSKRKRAEERSSSKSVAKQSSKESTKESLETRPSSSKILDSVHDQERTTTEDGCLVGQDGGSEDTGSEKQLAESQEHQTSHVESYLILDSDDDEEGKSDNPTDMEDSFQVLDSTEDPKEMDAEDNRRVKDDEEAEKQLPEGDAYQVIDTFDEDTGGNDERGKKERTSKEDDNTSKKEDKPPKKSDTPTSQSESGKREKTPQKEDGTRQRFNDEEMPQEDNFQVSDSGEQTTTDNKDNNKMAPEESLQDGNQAAKDNLENQDDKVPMEDALQIPDSTEYKIAEENYRKDTVESPDDQILEESFQILDSVGDENPIEDDSQKLPSTQVPETPSGQLVEKEDGRIQEEDTYQIVDSVEDQPATEECEEGKREKTAKKEEKTLKEDVKSTKSDITTRVSKNERKKTPESDDKMSKEENNAKTNRDAMTGASEKEVEEDAFEIVDSVEDEQNNEDLTPAKEAQKKERTPKKDDRASKKEKTTRKSSTPIKDSEGGRKERTQRKEERTTKNDDRSVRRMTRAAKKEEAETSSRVVDCVDDRPTTEHPERGRKGNTTKKGGRTAKQEEKPTKKSKAAKEASTIEEEEEAMYEIVDSVEDEPIVDDLTTTEEGSDRGKKERTTTKEERTAKKDDKPSKKSDNPLKDSETGKRDRTSRKEERTGRKDDKTATRSSTIIEPPTKEEEEADTYQIVDSLEDQPMNDYDLTPSKEREKKERDPKKEDKAAIKEDKPPKKSDTPTRDSESRKREQTPHKEDGTAKRDDKPSRKSRTKTEPSMEVEDSYQILDSVGDEATVDSLTTEEESERGKKERTSKKDDNTSTTTKEDKPPKKSDTPTRDSESGKRERTPRKEDRTAKRDDKPTRKSRTKTEASMEVGDSYQILDSVGDEATVDSLTTEEESERGKKERTPKKDDNTSKKEDKPSKKSDTPTRDSESGKRERTSRKEETTGKKDDKTATRSSTIIEPPTKEEADTYQIVDSLEDQPMNDDDLTPSKEREKKERDPKKEDKAAIKEDNPPKKSDTPTSQSESGKREQTPRKEDGTAKRDDKPSRKSRTKTEASMEVEDSYQILDSVGDEATVDSPTTEEESERGKKERTPKRDDDTSKKEDKPPKKSDTPTRDSESGKRERTPRKEDGTAKRDDKPSRKTRTTTEASMEVEDSYQILDSVGDEPCNDSLTTEEESERGKKERTPKKDNTSKKEEKPPKKSDTPTSQSESGKREKTPQKEDGTAKRDDKPTRKSRTTTEASMGVEDSYQILDSVEDEATVDSLTTEEESDKQKQEITSREEGRVAASEEEEATYQIVDSFEDEQTEGDLIATEGSDGGKKERTGKKDDTTSKEDEKPTKSSDTTTAASENENKDPTAKRDDKPSKKEDAPTKDSDSPAEESKNGEKDDMTKEEDETPEGEEDQTTESALVSLDEVSEEEEDYPDDTEEEEELRRRQAAAKEKQLGKEREKEREKRRSKEKEEREKERRSGSCSSSRAGGRRRREKGRGRDKEVDPEELLTLDEVGADEPGGDVDGEGGEERSGRTDGGMVEGDLQALVTLDEIAVEAEEVEGGAGPSTTEPLPPSQEDELGDGFNPETLVTLDEAGGDEEEEETKREHAKKTSSTAKRKLSTDHTEERMNFVTVDEVGWEEEEEEVVTTRRGGRPKKRGRQTPVRRSTRGKGRTTKEEKEEEPPTEQQPPPTLPDATSSLVKDPSVSLVDDQPELQNKEAEVGENRPSIDASSTGQDQQPQPPENQTPDGGMETEDKAEARAALKDISKQRREVVESEAKRSRSQSPVVPANFKMPPFRPNNPIGVEFVVPKTGYFCKLCSVFYENENSAKNVHCGSQRHYQNMETHYQKLQEQTGSSSQGSTSK